MTRTPRRLDAPPPALPAGAARLPARARASPRRSRPVALVAGRSPPAAAPARGRVKELARGPGNPREPALRLRDRGRARRTGDTERVLFTQQSVAQHARQDGASGSTPRRVRARQRRGRQVTGRLPATRAPLHPRRDGGVHGQRPLDRGGVLLLRRHRGRRPGLRGARGRAGRGGYLAGAPGAWTSKNTPTAGASRRARRWSARSSPPSPGTPLVLALHNPDFTTASRIAIAGERGAGQGSGARLDRGGRRGEVPTR